MQASFLELLRCTNCGGALAQSGERLSCAACKHTYPLLRGVPRFVDPSHYSSSFGYEWQRFAETQYDSHSGRDISRRRLFKQTKWPERMEGERILEAGCGSGRFTEQLLTTKATVVSIDASVAVDENYNHHKDRPNSHIAQADLMRLPFAQGSFDRVLCIGVLQHTADPFASLRALTDMVRPGGHLAVDIYDKAPWYKRIFNTRYWVRPLTRRMQPERLHALVDGYVRLMWPLVRLIHKLPRGRDINHKLLVAEHLGYQGFTDEQQKEWAILDTFDWLSPRYEQTQTAATMRAWCARLPLKEVEVSLGYGGIEVRAVRA